jgi:hypothetical protein
MESPCWLFAVGYFRLATSLRDERGGWLRGIGALFYYRILWDLSTALRFGRDDGMGRDVEVKNGYKCNSRSSRFAEG